MEKRTTKPRFQEFLGGAIVVLTAIGLLAVSACEVIEDTNKQVSTNSVEYTDS